MRRVTPFLWAITIILVLRFGIYAGHKVTAAYKDAELTRLSMQLDRANDELAFWQATLRRVVEGDQITEIIGSRPNEAD
jgi:hypothetical protein